MTTGSGPTACSAKYLAALKAGSHVQISKAEVWAGSALLATFQLEASSTYACDRNNAIRRTCSVTLTEGVATHPDGSNAKVAPQTAADIFNPYGNELVLYRGIQFADATTELIQLGVFGIEDVHIDSSADLAVTVTGNDRSRNIARSGFVDVYTINPGTNVGTAVQALISSRWIGQPLQFSFAATTAVTPTTPIVYKPGDDPWAKATELVETIGYEVFFDAMGVCTLLPVPNPNKASVAWTFSADPGNVDNIATKFSRVLSRANAPNTIIRVGQGTGIAAPVQQLVSDTNPLSPTYVGGPYGAVVDYQSSSLYTNTAQALAAANADLLLALGTVESLTVTSEIKPDTDVDQVVIAQRTAAGITTPTKYVVDSVRMGFGHSGTMDIGGRSIAAVLP